MKEKNQGQKVFPQFKEDSVVPLLDWIMSHGHGSEITVLHMEEDTTFLHSKEDNSYLLIKSPTIVNEEV